MRQYELSDPWMPGHVIMGSSISVHSTFGGSNVLILEELREAGVMSDRMRVNLVRSAHIASKAIAKMLVS